MVSTNNDLEAVLEAVGGRLVAALAVLLAPLAEQQRPLVQEEVPLHGLEARQLLHARGALLVADPHTEGALHQHAAQLTQLPLGRRGGPRDPRRVREREKKEREKKKREGKKRERGRGGEREAETVTQGLEGVLHQFASSFV